jgi:hypothetical protein
MWEYGILEYRLPGETALFLFLILRHIFLKWDNGAAKFLNRRVNTHW